MGNYLGPGKPGSGPQPVYGLATDPTSITIRFSLCVSISAVTGIEYQVNGGAWTQVTSVLKVSDTEWDFAITTPAIALGDTVSWRYIGGSGTIVDCVDAEDIGDQGPYPVQVPGVLSTICGTAPDGIVGTPYSHTVGSSGGWPPVTISLQAGTLPTGLSHTNGAISGTPSAVQQTTQTWRSTDAELNTNDCGTTIDTYAVLTITTSSLPSGKVGQAYSETLASTGGKAPVTWSVVSGSLPAGLSLNSGTGEISGTPSLPQTSNFTVRATDALGQTDDQALSILIVVGVALDCGTPPIGVVGLAYSHQLQVIGGVPPYTYTVQAGTLPDGLALASDTGLISGTPTTPETQALTFRVTDDTLDTADCSTSIEIVSALDITTTTLPDAVAEQAYSETLQATGGKAPYTWRIDSGSLPAGLSLNTGTGEISGSPDSDGTSNFTVGVIDASLQDDTQALSINATAALRLDCGNPPAGTVGVEYFHQLLASGGVPPYSYSVVEGTLPDGLVLNN